MMGIKNKNCTVGTISNSRKEERGILDTTNTEIHDVHFPG